MRILLAEDESDLNDLLTRKFTAEGYGVDSVADGCTALQYLCAAEYDAAVLDIMMPGMDGLAVLKALRARHNRTPVLLLTARDSIEDRVLGLDSGANDYLVKPFSPAELSARLRALTRAAHAQHTSLLCVGDLRMDCAKQQVWRGEERIALSAREYALLEYLMHNEGVVLSREKIENHIWNFDYEGGTNVVDVYIRYLRKKIDEGRAVKLIHTVRGRGYVLQVAP